MKSKRTEVARLKWTANHEAGHVAAAYHYDNGIYAVRLRMKGQSEIVSRRGRVTRVDEVDGLVEPMVGFNWHIEAMSAKSFADYLRMHNARMSATDLEELCRNIMDMALRETIRNLAGGFAEAALRHVSFDQLWMEGGTK
jgi:hypothetical protein